MLHEEGEVILIKDYTGTLIFFINNNVYRLIIYNKHCKKKEDIRNVHFDFMVKFNGCMTLEYIMIL